MVPVPYIWSHLQRDERVDALSLYFAHKETERLFRETEQQLRFMSHLSWRATRR
jgi:hypothetical protein